jgi:hypothetical protein
MIADFSKERTLQSSVPNSGNFSLKKAKSEILRGFGELVDF